MSEQKEEASSSKKFELSPAVAIIIAGAIIAGSIMYVNGHPAPDAANAAAAAAIVPTDATIRQPDATDHIIGSPDAPIVLVEYSDFQCPFCQMIYPELKNIVEKSNGQIAWVMRNFPLTSIHPNATPAANAAECIAALGGNDAFWKFASTVFANQSKLSDAYYAELASAAGVDQRTYKTCVTQKTYQARIDEEANEAMTIGGNGTPFTVVVNTKTHKMAPISGALPEAQIINVINAIK